MVEQTSGNVSRRSLIRSAGVATALGATSLQAQSAARPNIVMVIADQTRWDCVGAYGANPLDVTPNINALAGRGTLYRHAFVSQPVCSPSRASMFTGQYPARHGVWRNTHDGVALNPVTPTIATELAKAGYSANYIGKWHLADGPNGPVAASARGGFLGLWEASNVLEMTSHSYEGEMYDGDGRAIAFKDQYRVDFLKDRAKRFLNRAPADEPFLLVVSFLEPHQQNDLGRMIAPKGFAERYQNPYVPLDLRRFPGDWQQQLPDYYGCLSSVDSAVGEIVSTLTARGLDRNTIIVFLSDHGCQFMTRNTEYKRSGHDSSIRIPLIISGPGFEGGREVKEFAASVDLMPTLLEAAGVSVPASVQGRSLKATGRTNEVFFQLSEFWNGRGLRTEEWTFVAVAPRTAATHVAMPNVPTYHGFQLYDNRADPYQLVNLAGRKETKAAEEMLRKRLLARMREAGDPAADVSFCEYPYA
jgi:arylsulfatase A-like enzyme